MGPWWAAGQRGENSLSLSTRSSRLELPVAFPGLTLRTDPAVGDAAGDPTAGSEGHSAGESVPPMGCIWQGQVWGAREGWGVCALCAECMCVGPSADGQHVCAQGGSPGGRRPSAPGSCGAGPHGPTSSGRKRSLPGLRAVGRRFRVPWEGSLQLPRGKLRGLIVPRRAACWPLA